MSKSGPIRTSMNEYNLVITEDVKRSRIEKSRCRKSLRSHFPFGVVYLLKMFINCKFPCLIKLTVIQFVPQFYINHTFFWIESVVGNWASRKWGRR